MKSAVAVITSLATFVLIPTAAWARIIHVPDSISTIQAGITAAVNGDTVLVDSGVYQECINFQGKAILVASNFIFSNDTADIENTVIDANRAGSVVTFANGEDTNSVLTGFTIRNGFATNGGGVYCRVASSPIIRSNIIENNSTSADGAGVYITDSAAPIVIGNIIRHNSTPYWGGGIYVFDGSSPALIRNIIYNNGSTSRAGSASALLPEPGSGPFTVAGRFIRTLPAGAELISCGGGILVTNYTGLPTRPLILNNTIDGNTVSDRGGGIFSNLAEPDIRNNIITANQGYGIYHQGTAITVSYNDIWGNATNTGGTVQLGPGSLSANPCYVDSAANNFHLQANSPCIDSGDPTSPPDPDGTRADMGAYYHHHVAISEARLARVQPLQITPNPFCHCARIRNWSGPVSIYDPAGRLVQNCLGTTIGTDLTPGAYLVQAQGLAPVWVVKLAR